MKKILFGLLLAFLLCIGPVFAEDDVPLSNCFNFDKNDVIMLYKPYVLEGENIKVIDHNTFVELAEKFVLKQQEKVTPNTQNLEDGAILCVRSNSKAPQNLFLGLDGTARPCRIHIVNYGNANNDGFEFFYDSCYRYDSALIETLWERGVSLTNEDGGLAMFYNGVRVIEEPRPVEYPGKGDILIVEDSRRAGILPFDIGVDENPERNLTRERFCELAFNMLAKSEKGLELAYEPVFHDTNNSRVNALFHAGLINGVGDGLFAPEQYVTRETAAIVANRMADYFGLKRDPQWKNFLYADDEMISAWAREDIYQLQSMQIMVGKEFQLFDPKAYLDRYDGVRIIKRIIEKYDEMIEYEKLGIE